MNNNQTVVLVLLTFIMCFAIYKAVFIRASFNQLVDHIELVEQKIDRVLNIIDVDARDI